MGGERTWLIVAMCAVVEAILHDRAKTPCVNRMSCSFEGPPGTMSGSVL